MSLLWSHPVHQAFNAFKLALAATAKLEHPQSYFPISLMVDESNTHVSAVLQHFRCSSWAHSPSSQRSCQPPTLATGPSTGSCWRSIPRSATSASCWRLGSSSSSPTTSLSAMPWAGSWLPGLLVSSGIWHTFLSSNRTFGASLTRIMSQPTPCHS